MILYFSGTGNSEYVAKYLAGELTDNYIMPVTDPECMAILKETISSGASYIGFVFPIYSWGVPQIISDFISDIAPDIIDDINKRNIAVWMVATCGDETGNAHVMFRKACDKSGLKVRGMWSVVMPNTYVLLPGFDVDSDHIRETKLKVAPDRIRHIASRIQKGIWECDITKGSMPCLKTMLVFPFFKKWGINSKKWKATQDCIGCGRCMGACPVKNITIIDSKPVWGNNCVSCLACYHVCNTHAVQYGTVTRNKGQYSLQQRPVI